MDQLYDSVLFAVDPSALDCYVYVITIKGTVTAFYSFITINCKGFITLNHSIDMKGLTDIN